MAVLIRPTRTRPARDPPPKSCEPSGQPDLTATHRNAVLRCVYKTRLRCVPAIAAAPATERPTTRRAAAAAATVLPVVTRSSTITTGVNRDGRARWGRATNLPAAAIPRSAAVRSALSGRSAANARSGATRTATPRRRRMRAARLASRSTCWPPRRRATALADGIETSHSGPSSSSATAAASADASGRARSRRPRSLYASRHVRTTPA